MTSQQQQHRPPETPQEYAELQGRLHELAGRSESLKEYALSLDIRRQGNREAAGGLRRHPPEEGKVWMASGDIFLRFTSDRAQAMIEADSAETSKELEDVRAEQKEVASEIERLDGTSGGAAHLFRDLRPMSKEDMRFVNRDVP
eukprot:CAMPEP_0173386650 /NCGR_PEP_ID=MMETSP1356-20130122/9237_1 /TAXON_ID=77927 ORGANISM="Hemiselmis virescens, Strain PCC157" /NCGR_SAMPLE_ID=MMETSP1356 /ASSEMBLY_ACC=CAM_ASM_000847 /LENGTH=143 /DNA_ID=CAMNT_0014342965 /DNA_START=17 /DNA_END=448 /DNA_ORIENTATION=-